MLHQKTFYVNSDKQWITNVQGYNLRILPSFYWSDNLLLKFYITDSNGNAVNLSTYDQFYLGAGYTFVYQDTPLFDASNAEFNDLSDWDQVDLAAGRICCRLNCRPQVFANFLGSVKKRTAYLDLWGLKTGQAPTLFFQSKIDAKNPVAIRPPTSQVVFAGWGNPLLIPWGSTVINGTYTWNGEYYSGAKIYKSTYIGNPIDLFFVKNVTYWTLWAGTDGSHYQDQIAYNDNADISSGTWQSLYGITIGTVNEVLL